jgi:hypothetical protein
MYMRSRTGLRLLVLSLSLSGAASAATPSPNPDKPRPDGPAAVDAGASLRPVTVTHKEDDGDWSVAETTNFVIRHRHPRAFAEKVARVAERTREVQIRRWFSAANEVWKPRCAIYLYTDPEEYSQATGAPPQSPGLTRIEGEGDRIWGRRIDLHGRPEELLRAVLPHEVTHTVLAGRFGARVPRWADEGMAVLSEPRDRVEGHLRFLPRWRDEGRLLPLRRLMDQEDYPEPRFWGSFYGQSVSLVDFLVEAKGAPTFAAFLREGLRDGYTSALRHHYGWTYRELERHWFEHAFPETP